MDTLRYRKEVLDQCYTLFSQGVSKGLSFIQQNSDRAYIQTLPRRVEVGTNARYLRRGFYCPSPVLHSFVSNSRRGRLLRRPNKNSKLTHRFFFDDRNELYLVEHLQDTVLPVPVREYLVREGDFRYGFAIDQDRMLCAISIEHYQEDIIRSYLFSPCYFDTAFQEYKPGYVHYETYLYETEKVTGYDLHYVYLPDTYPQDPDDILQAVDHKSYDLSYKDSTTPVFLLRSQTPKSDVEAAKAFLQKLVGQTFRYAEINTEMGWFEFGLGEKRNKCDGGEKNTGTHILQAACQVQLISMAGKVDAFDIDATQEAFSATMQQLAELPVKRVGVNGKNDLCLDFGKYWLLLVTYEISEASWCFFMPELAELQLIGADTFLILEPL